MLGDYIFSSVIFIVATRLQSARLFLTARGERSLRGYAFITLDFYFTGTLLRDTMKLGGSWQGMSRDELINAFEGLVTLSVKKPSRKEVQNITKWLNEKLKATPKLKRTKATQLVRHQ